MKRLLATKITGRAVFLIAALIMASWSAARADEGPSDKIPPSGALRGNFQEDHYFKSEGKPLHSEGHFVLVPAHGILWVVEKPVPFSFIITPQGLTQALGTFPLSQIPQSKLPMLSEVTHLLVTTLGGDWHPLEKDFTVARKSTAAHWDATITPKEGSKMPFQSLSFAGNKHIDSARALRANGGFDKFSFSDQVVTEGPLSAAEMGLFSIAVFKAP